MAGSHGGCPFLVQMVWRHFSFELKRLGSIHTPVVSQLLLSKTSRPVVGVSTVQTPHLCLQDLLPTSAYRDIPQCSSPGKLSEPSLSKHLTCVSRTYSQPQPIGIFPMLISRQVYDALDFTPAAYQPSVDCRTLVQAQHVSLRKRFRSSIQTISASP